MSPPITWTLLIGSDRPGSTYGDVAVKMPAAARKVSSSSRSLRISASWVPTANVIENVRLSPGKTPYLM